MEHLNPGQTDLDPEQLPSNPQVEAFREFVIREPQAAFTHWQQMQRQYETFQSNATPASSTEPTPPPHVAPITIGAEQLADMVAQAVARTLAQATQNHPPAPQSSTPFQAKAPSTFRSEKLPDIPEYDGDRDRLDAWEQSLVQKITANDDRFPEEHNKIAYAESRLTIGKKAHSLMGQYRKDGLCTLTTLSDWRQKLRHLCGNPFEEEDARTYLRDTLKQGTTPFHEYYHLFCQKKERSRMDDTALLDCLKRNVNYTVQEKTFTWRTKQGNRPVTFNEHVEAYNDIDSLLSQLKHRQPRLTNNAGTSNPPRPKPSTPQATPLAGSRSTPIVPLVAVTSATTAIPAGEPMDLSTAIAAVKGKPLSVPGVKDICNKWQLCYYCKYQHPGKTAKECPNKKPFNLRTFDLDDTANNDGGVPLYPGNA